MTVPPVIEAGELPTSHLNPYKRTNRHPPKETGAERPLTHARAILAGLTAPPRDHGDIAIEMQPRTGQVEREPG